MDAAPLAAPTFTGTLAQRWTVPVVWSNIGVDGRDPQTGEIRWWIRHHDREATHVRVWNPDSGDMLCRGDRWLDDLVGVTDGVVIWLDGRGQKGTVRLTGVDLRTGTQLVEGHRPPGVVVGRPSADRRCGRSRVRRRCPQRSA